MRAFFVALFVLAGMVSLLGGLFVTFYVVALGKAFGSASGNTTLSMADFLDPELMLFYGIFVVLGSACFGGAYLVSRGGGNESR